MNAHQLTVGALCFFLLTGPSMGQAVKSDADSTSSTAVESNESKPQVSPLPTKLDGRWERTTPGGRTVGGTTSIRIASQADGKVSGTFSYYAHFSSTCATTENAPFEASWDGTTLRLLVKREPECRNFRWVVRRGKDHLLEGHGGADSTLNMFYDEAR